MPRGNAYKSGRKQRVELCEAAFENDPFSLSRCGIVPPISSRFFSSGNQRFRNDYSSFVQLIESSYCLLVFDGRFRVNVSLSQYSYYCVVLLWRRILCFDDLSSLKHLNSRSSTLPSLAVPEEINIYLKGIGDITDYAGIQCDLTVGVTLREETYEGIAGTYGPITADNHYDYETLPSPFVALYRILQDYAHTRCNASPDWDLPAGLRPPGSFFPNRNLLGWNRAMRLTPDQAKLCEEAEIFAETVDGVVTYNAHGVQNWGGFPLVSKLILSISTILGSSYAGRCQPECTALKGSGAQVPFLQRELQHEKTHGIAVSPVYEALAVAYCCHDSMLCSAANCFRYRVKRQIESSTDNLCYTGTDGTAPPGWIATADVVFNTAVSSWNYGAFVSTPRDGKVDLFDFCQRVRDINAS